MGYSKLFEDILNENTQKLENSLGNLGIQCANYLKSSLKSLEWCYYDLAFELEPKSKPLKESDVQNEDVNPDLREAEDFSRRAEETINRIEQRLNEINGNPYFEDLSRTRTAINAMQNSFNNSIVSIENETSSLEQRIQKLYELKETLINQRTRFEGIIETCNERAGERDRV
jgi:predicted  nucleic acid-binding Zn-ribbon protein